MLKATYSRYFLAFNEPAKTSRETMMVKETYFVKIWDDSNPEVYGIGECAIFRGLSADDTPGYEQLLADTCKYIHLIRTEDIASSSIRFGIETALNNLTHNCEVWNQSQTSLKPLRINGLIWMGNQQQMLELLEAKLCQGFRCIKLKIGGIDWDSELDIIHSIRRRYSPEIVELRLDANEAFTPDVALQKLDQLAPYSIHSIEQPIKRGHWQQLANIIKYSPIPIALDEELIGITPDQRKHKLLSEVKPHYIILKPSLCGGLAEATKWIEAATENGIGWWATSALESNVGLNAIYQWVSRFNPSMPQGLGTGQLYRNNISSPLRQTGETISYNIDSGWDYSQIVWR